MFIYDNLDDYINNQVVKESLFAIIIDANFDVNILDRKVNFDNLKENNGTMNYYIYHNINF